MRWTVPCECTWWFAGSDLALGQGVSGLVVSGDRVGTRPRHFTVISKGMTQPSIPKMTLDTNCIVGLFDRRNKTATSVDELRDLMRYALSGVIQISITTRVEVDFGRDKNEERREDMMQHIGMLPVIGTVARWDQSRFEGADVSAGPEQQALLEEIRRIIFPGLGSDSGKYLNKLADIDHLVGHKLAGRDIFVTDDKGILRRYLELRDGPGILVMTPAEALRFADGHFARLQKKELEPTDDNVDYRDKRLKGTVTFDYSNNDHRFSIGDGLWFFETRWSKASDQCIHAYCDPPSIDSIALAKGVSEIADITDASSCDFSSRVRSPRIGQIVIWRNINNIYAATKILGIKDDSRGSEQDELAFEFLILSDGSINFSGR